MLYKKISIAEAEQLLELYYEGLTSVEQENQLREFLAQKNLPQQFEMEKAIFGYFENEKPRKNVFRIPNYLRWTASVAAVVVILMGVIFSNRPETASYAYVDGKKITDEKVIISLARTTVNNLSVINTEVEAGMDNFRGNNLIENQLNAFSGIQF